MNDITLSFSDSGSGFPLILLHGNGESKEYFANQIPYFSKSRRVIAVDTRGHGKSPRGSAPFTLVRFAEDLYALLTDLGIGSADLLGFSDGGNIALIFAQKYPQMVRKLILNGANLFPSGVRASYQIPICIGYCTAAFISLFDKNAVAKRELLGLMVNQPHISPESLSALTLPVLVIVGTDDMIRDKHSGLIAASLPNSTFMRIEGTHFIAEKESEKFNAAVENFLDD